jgi:hypothetical protein
MHLLKYYIGDMKAVFLKETWKVSMAMVVIATQALLCSKKYACYVPKIPQGRTLSYYPCQNVDRTQPTFTFAATELSIVNKIGRLSVSMGV